jgi:hypothetical protein
VTYAKIIELAKNQPAKKWGKKLYLALGLLVLQLLEVILLLSALFAPLSDVLLELFIKIRALLLLVLQIDQQFSTNHASV